MERKTTLVRVNLRQSTIDSANNIQRIQKLPNKATVVARGIDLLYIIAKEMKNGSEVFIKSDCGCRKQLSFMD
jgi:hypothetical protein